MNSTNANRRGGGDGQQHLGRYLSYFILKDGESKIVRFLTDIEDTPTVDFYEFIQDRNKKFQNFVYAPSWESGSEDWVAKYGGMTLDYNTKQLVEPRPRERSVGLVVEREEVSSGETKNRSQLKTQDLLSEFKGRDGKNYTARNFLIIKQGHRFWEPFKSYYQEFGTICDRDYKITRSGTGMDIVYSVIPKLPDPGWNPDGSSLQALRERYGYGTGNDVDGNPLTPESEDRFLYCSQTLPEWLKNQASEERARYALIGDGESIANSSRAPIEIRNIQSDLDADTDDEPNAAVMAGNDVAALRARLERHR